MKRLLIVGAGVSGLAAAFRVQQRAPAIDVTVLEQRERVGGNAWTEQRDGFQVELGPNGFLDSKPTTVQLCRDLGIGDQLIPASEAAGKNRYLFLDGQLKRLPASALDLLRTDLLSWRGKLRLLSERWRRPGDSTTESIDAFVRRRAGDEAALLADALVTGIHGGDPTLLSVRAAFPRLAAFETQHGSVMQGMRRSAQLRRAEAAARGETYQRGSTMWSFRAGLRLLVQTLRNQLRQPPRLGVSVRRIRRSAAGWVVHGPDQETWTADAVVLACPAYAQAELLADLDAPLAERIAGIAYNRIAVVALGYRATDVPRPADGFGFIAPQRTRRDILGVQWCSTIFPERAPTGSILVRALAGGWHRAEVAGWEDGRLLEAVRAELRLAMGITAAPCFEHIVRWDRAIPQYQLGHLERVAWIEERARTHPGLFLAGNAYHGVALNDCTEQGGLVAERIAAFLAGQP